MSFLHNKNEICTHINIRCNQLYELLCLYLWGGRKINVSKITGTILTLFWLKFLVNMKISPLNAELNPICYLLALLAHHFLHVSRIGLNH